MSELTTLQCGLARRVRKWLDNSGESAVVTCHCFQRSAGSVHLAAALVATQLSQLLAALSCIVNAGM